MFRSLRAYKTGTQLGCLKNVAVECKRAAVTELQSAAPTLADLCEFQNDVYPIRFAQRNRVFVLGSGEYRPRPLLRSGSCTGHQIQL